ncbi:MAG: aminoacetone oxidase family FAD-binding enzyme [Eubacterium sp.]|nr:aminoacetone oxidase family FAD-binding enzyme [Eubacterium sp.]
MTVKNVVIVGGGASGLMAGILLADGGAKVTILEANENPGRKLLATGNGRCNLTNRKRKPGDLRGEDPDFNNRVLDRFTVDDTLAFFHGIGLATLDRDGWVYPITGQAKTVLELLMLKAAEEKVKIKTREKVIRIEKNRNMDGFTVFTESWHYTCDNVIVACGSPASAVRGSSGDAVRFARSFDIDTKAFEPALVPLRIKENYGRKWSGTRLKASIQILSDGKEIASESGEVQLTDRGISGIPVMQVSRYALESAKRGALTAAVMDFLPDIDEKDLQSELNKRQASFPERSQKQLLIGLLPDRLIDVLADRAKSGSPIAHLIKNFSVVILPDASFEMAQVCSGGILTRELTEDMEARKVPGLYFTGEAVDSDGTCGGYNLQWAWSTAALAAAGILKISTYYS